MNMYVQLFLWSLVPVAASVIIYLLKRTTAFGKTSKTFQTIFVGVIFGIIACLGTEFGVNVGGATANVRDAAPLCAGLIFGGPSGIIAGVIGGVERFFAAYWGRGEYSQIACSISTILAGFYAMFLRRFLFEKQRPSWGYGFATGVVMEVIHLTILFLTHLNDTEQALQIVKIVTVPMLVFNGLSVMLACFFVSLISKDVIHKERHRKQKVSDVLQLWLLGCIVVAYMFTTGFIYRVQTGIANRQVEELLTINVKDVEKDISSTIDEDLLHTTRTIKSEYEADNSLNLKELLKIHDVSEINIVNSNGIIIATSEDGYLNYDMNSGVQSREFQCLLGESEEYVQEYMLNSFSGLGRKYAGVKLGDGYVQVAYDSNKFQTKLFSSMQSIIENRHIGKTGYIVIIDEEGNIIHDIENVGPSKLSESDMNFFSNEEDQYKVLSFNKGEDIFCMYTKAEGYLIVAIQPYAEAFAARDADIYLNSYMQVIVFALLLFAVYSLVKHLIIIPIRKVNGGLEKIVSGDLDVTVKANNTIEGTELTDSINSTVKTLKDYIEEAETRMDKELEFAKNIQLSALPQVFPAFTSDSRYELYASMNTAKEVGGDFYDFYKLTPTKIAFLIADVSGKGIPAAMFMMTAKTMIKNYCEAGYPLEEAITKANEKLCETNEAEMFVTAWIGTLDLENGHLEYINCGHNPPLLYKAGEEYTYIKSKAGFVLAGMDGYMYKKQEMDLNPGDKLYLYTDGVTEASNKDSELYGEDRLLKVLNDSKAENPKDTITTISLDLGQYVNGFEQSDDITMLMIQYNGNEAETIKDEKKFIEKERVFTSDDENLPDALGFVEEQLTKYNASEKAIMQIDVALEELFVNVCHYAYGDGVGNVVIRTEFDEVERNFMIELSDSGIPFNPLEKESPDITLSAEERDIGGLGIFMVLKTMDKVDYEYKNGKNILTIIKKI